LNRKADPIGYFHIDIAEVRTGQGELYLLVPIDRTSKFAFVEVHEKATQRIAADFLKALIQTVPYKIHTVLTDNGVHFTTPGNRCSAAAAEIKLALEGGELFRAHVFEFACAKADPPPPVVRYEHNHPGDLIHFDIKRLARIVSLAIASTETAPARHAAQATSISIAIEPALSEAEGTTPVSASPPSCPTKPTSRLCSSL